MGIKLMVSIWPTVDNGLRELPRRCWRTGCLIRTRPGRAPAMDFHGHTPLHFDATNPGAREIMSGARPRRTTMTRACASSGWTRPSRNTPPTTLITYRYHSGPQPARSANIYPSCYAQAFYDGMTRGRPGQISSTCVRCAWAGSQKYGALVWSGDIPLHLCKLCAISLPPG